MKNIDFLKYYNNFQNNDEILLNLKKREIRKKFYEKSNWIKKIEPVPVAKKHIKNTPHR